MASNESNRYIIIVLLQLFKDTYMYGLILLRSTHNLIRRAAVCTYQQISLNAFSNP